MVLFLVTVWMLFGFLSLFAVMALTFLAITFKILPAGIYKNLDFSVIVFSLPVIALLFGAATGYFDAWTDHDWWASGCVNKWYYIFAVLGWPGDMIAENFWGDWQEDECWYHRDKVALWNGFFWLSIAVVAAPLIFLKQKLNQLETHQTK